MIGKAVAPAAFDNLYFNFVMPPGITYGVMMLVGLFFGGMIGAATSGTLKWGKKDCRQQRRAVEAHLWPTDLEALGAGFSARSSWNMPPGSPGAAPAAWPSRAGCCSPRQPFSFIAGMFASGIVTALIDLSQEVLKEPKSYVVALVWAVFGFCPEQGRVDQVPQDRERLSLHRYGWSCSS